MDTPENSEPPEVIVPEIEYWGAGVGPPPPPPPLQLPRQMARKQDVISIRIRTILNTAPFFRLPRPPISTIPFFHYSIIPIFHSSVFPVLPYPIFQSSIIPFFL
jgi:hypothetical protein